MLDRKTYLNHMALKIMKDQVNFSVAKEDADQTKNEKLYKT